MQISKDTTIVRTLSEASMRDILQAALAGDPREAIVDVTWVEQPSGNYLVIKSVIEGTKEGTP